MGASILFFRRRIQVNPKIWGMLSTGEKQTSEGMSEHDTPLTIVMVMSFFSRRLAESFAGRWISTGPALETWS